MLTVFEPTASQPFIYNTGCQQAINLLWDMSAVVFTVTLVHQGDKITIRWSKSAINWWLNGVLTVINCAKLAKIINLLASTYTELHINHWHSESSQNLLGSEQKFRNNDVIATRWWFNCKMTQELWYLTSRNIEIQPDTKSWQPVESNTAKRRLTASTDALQCVDSKFENLDGNYLQAFIICLRVTAVSLTQNWMFGDRLSPPGDPRSPNTKRFTASQGNHRCFHAWRWLPCFYFSVAEPASILSILSSSKCKRSRSCRIPHLSVIVSLFCFIIILHAKMQTLHICICWNISHSEAILSPNTIFIVISVSRII